MTIITMSRSSTELWDSGFRHLEGLLRTLDSSLSSIHEQIKAAEVCEVEIICEQGEYLIGVGFCAMQRYLFDVLQDIEIEASYARKLGPKSQKGEPLAKLIHAAANYWKHESEWHIWLDKLRNDSQKTVDIILQGKESADYPLADLLSELCGAKPLLLVNCLPQLLEWRAAVWQHTTKNI